MLAKRFPKGISEEVQKIVEYYETQSLSQLQEIHRLTLDNHQMKKKLEKEDKENKDFMNNDEAKDQRISFLEEKTLQKDKKINELNQ